MSPRPRLEENLKECLGRIQDARADGSAVLIAVTKSVEPELALELAALGVLDLGESRLPEFERKLAAFRDAKVEVRWHFIGHLQRNKARRVVREAYALHSVDSLRLLETLARLAQEEGRSPLLFLQVKLSDEDTKTGFAPDELTQALALARGSQLKVLGLMAMAPRPEAGHANDKARETFRQLADLARDLPPDQFVDGRARLSMGMSNDFEIALAEGADFVRVGSALFRTLPLRSARPVSGRSTKDEAR